ncbi:MAG: PilN domain-containing protein [Candidatus Omnitrophica bacterium]|nr:PilN domain-containing protein [Candidatus Omnitrophota bacterium]
MYKHTESKKTLFVCQLTDDFFKAVKYVRSRNGKREVAGLEVEAVSLDDGENVLKEKVARIFKKLNYCRDHVIVSLLCHQATCRYLKIPAQNQQEIEKIAYLQASRYLPYPAHELTVGYQVISADKEGYTDINLIIVHKSIIEKYLELFQELRPKTLTIALSSYGLSNFYRHAVQQIEPGVVMLVDVELPRVELVIISQEKVLFSRSFNIPRANLHWQDLFLDQIKKTQDAYSKEVSSVAPARVILMGHENASVEFQQLLKEKGAMPVEIISCGDKAGMPKALLDSSAYSSHSFASLFGFGLKDIDNSINLLPFDMKEGIKRASGRKDFLRIVFLFLASVIMLAGGVFKMLDNKAAYLRELKGDLNKIANEAKPLAEIEHRLQLLDNESAKKPTGLDVLSELHEILPEKMFLLNFSYEEARQVILRGQSQEINAVSELVRRLGSSETLKKFSVKLEYATKRRTPSGEVIDFEVTCLKTGK